MEKKLTKCKTATKRQNKPKMKLKHGPKLTLCSTVNHEERTLCLVELKKWLNNSGTLTQLRNKDANERTTFPEGA